MSFRKKYPANQYPFSDELCLFMDNHLEFFHSLKLSNPRRFNFIPLIFTSHTPPNHPNHRDEVIGMWYLDNSQKQCGTHKRGCPFKQDFVVNIRHENQEFVSYSTDNNDDKYVKPITTFFNLYGANGKFYHDGKEWQHHYSDVLDLPDEPKLRLWAKDLKGS